MTTSQIDAFLALCRYGNISSAAEKLYLTQPALTRTIQSLEKEIGHVLFVRKKGNRHIELTTEGELFYTIANDMSHLYAQARNLASCNARRVLRVSCASSFASVVLPKTCRRFRERHPDTDFIIDILHSSESFQQVQSNHIDIALVTAPYISPLVESVPLFQEKVVLLCSQGMFPEGPVSISQLDPSKAILTEWDADFRAWFEYHFGKNLDTPHYRIKVGGYVQYFCVGTEFWTLLPRISAISNLYGENKFEIHEMLDSPPNRICCCIYPRTGNHRIHDEWISAARDILQDIPDIQTL